MRCACVRWKSFIAIIHVIHNFDLPFDDDNQIASIVYAISGQCAIKIVACKCILHLTWECNVILWSRCTLLFFQSFNWNCLIVCRFLVELIYPIKPHRSYAMHKRLNRIYSWCHHYNATIKQRNFNKIFLSKLFRKIFTKWK